MWIKTSVTCKYLKSTIVYQCSKEINGLREKKSGYKKKPRETHKLLEENKGTSETMKCNKNKCQCNIQRIEQFDNIYNNTDLVLDILEK